MKHRIRLGPIAIFLAVIAAVVATLAMLTFATSRADMALAERFAAVTAIRYELDEEGNRFLQAVEEETRSRIFLHLAERVRIGFATLGNAAGYIGAAGLARQEWEDQHESKDWLFSTTQKKFAQPWEEKK